jgi:hypothetical protein
MAKATKTNDGDAFPGASDAHAASALANTRYVYTLAYPITFQNEEITDIEYRRPKGRDVRAAFKVRSAGGDMYTSMMVAICEQPEGLFDALDGSDFVAMTDIVDGFLSPPKKSKEGSTD